MYRRDIDLLISLWDKVDRKLTDKQKTSLSEGWTDLLHVVRTGNQPKEKQEPAENRGAS